MKNIIENKIDSSIIYNGKIMEHWIQSIDYESEYSGHQDTVKSFGEEWNTFTHEELSLTDSAANEYFDVFPLEKINKNWIAADVGCGTGRWARRIAPYVKTLYGIDPSDALNIFIKNTKNNSNIIPVKAYAENLPFQNSSLDLVLSLGVLHHIEKTEESILEINRILKENGVFLFYFYYNLEERSSLFKFLFHISNIMRKKISSFPEFWKNLTCDFLAIFIYLPLVIFAKVITFCCGNKIGSRLPLAGYRNKNFYIMRNDSRDRFGTPLEKRYSKLEIECLLKKNKFKEVVFSEGIPYWHGYAIK